MRVHVLCSIPLFLGTYFASEPVMTQGCDKLCSNITCSTPSYGTCCHKKNIARGSQKTSQSSEFWEKSLRRYFHSNLAVDGNTNTDFTSNTCTHTDNVNRTDAWWMINLDSTYNISEIKLFLRNDNPDRYNDLRVLVNSTECFHLNTTPPENHIQHIHCSPPIRGNLVSVSVHHWILTLCEVQIFTCDPDWYGEECDRQCNCRDLTDCDKTTGWCTDGCRAGKHGDGCQCDCEDGFYGHDCTESCGNCRDRTICDKVSGSCGQECVQGFKPPLCKDCEDGFYGHDCTESCGNCRDRTICDKVSGSCGQECVQGFKPPLCKDCEDGFYGHDCTESCGNCRDRTICDKVSGSCGQECVQGFKPPLCKDCEDGFYGHDCTESCGNCRDRTICDKVSGSCGQECVQGFKPPLCKDCEDGFYGHDCTESCGNCRDGTICDKVSGSCGQECVQGFKPPLCKECDDKRFGKNCLSICGKCLKNESCNKTDGTCRNGCEEHYNPPMCTECVDGMYRDNCDMKCGYCMNDLPCNKTTGECGDGCSSEFKPPMCNGCVQGRYGADCKSICGQCADNVTCTRDGTCPRGCHPGFTDELCQTFVGMGPNIAPIAGGVAAVIVIMIIIVVVIVILKRRRLQRKPTTTVANGGENRKDTSFINISEPKVTKQSKQKKITNHDAKVSSKSQETKNKPKNGPEQKAKKSATILAANQEPQEISFEGKPDVCPTEPPGGGNEYYSVIPAPITLPNLAQYIKDRMNSVGFDNEFKLLPYGIHDDHDEGKKPENKKRNRFLELYPYDHSRVVLKPELDADWDYINASYISGYRGTKTFIAAQGSNPVTVDDFWRMIWQQRVTKIVMVTRLMELTKKKCEQYWPDDEEMREFGNIRVHHEYSTVRRDSTIRTFKVKHSDDASESREITQLHFTSWPDHDVPSAPALVSFWKQFRRLHQEQDTGPVVVHCSAGVGRTGTFIALDWLFDEAEREEKVNVFNCVNQMRKARMNMVQTVSQYQFLHEVVLEAIQSKNTYYTSAEFDLKFGTGESFTADQEREIQRQFEKLNTMRKIFTDKQVSDAKLPENIGKNRDQNILPENKSKPYLMTPVKGRTQYINAVVLPSHVRPSALIATQTPLPDTVVDFWRLVYDHDIFNIICLEGYETLYPSEETVESGPFQICLYQRRSISSQTQITLSKLEQPDDSRQITVYKPSFERPSDLLEFVNEMETRGVFRQGKFLVHCNNGSDLCGLFCGVLNIITRLRHDREVDIFLDIRELQTVRPSFIHSLGQYKFCFDAVKEYERTTSIYTNV